MYITYDEIRNCSKSTILRIIPEFESCVGFNQNNPYHIYDIFEHTLVALERRDNFADNITSFAILFHDIGKPKCYTEDENGIGHFRGHARISAKMTSDILERMYMDSGTKDSIIQLVKYHDALFSENDKCIRRWVNKIGEVQLRRLFEVMRADILAQNPEYSKERLDHIDRLTTILNRLMKDYQE